MQHRAPIWCIVDDGGEWPNSEALQARTQAVRQAYLFDEPLPSDVIASHYEVDHIATNAADNRLCALQWIKGHLSNDNQHGTKTMFERRSFVQQRP